MRLILFAGKGGTGKTSLAAATACLAAARGVNTLVISLDPAHSLSDAFDLKEGLMEMEGKPLQIAPNLAIQEINVNVAIGEYWEDVHRYLSVLLNTAGLDQLVAEEIAILPGMEEISALLYINDYLKNKTYQALILDCAPTAESIRFVSLPTALDWYMKKVFKVERTVARYARPIVGAFSDVPLPDDDYFACLERLFKGLAGVDRVLTDRQQTTVRLIANPEKMVLRETQRAFTYFSLYGLAVEALILNRVWPQGQEGPLAALAQIQSEYRKLAREYFDPMPILEVPLQEHEVLGHDKLLALGSRLYGQADPLAPLYTETPLTFGKEDGRLTVSLHLPFAEKGAVDLHKIGDELIVQLGVLRRHVALPHSFAMARPSGAAIKGDRLEISFIPHQEEA